MADAMAEARRGWRGRRATFLLAFTGFALLIALGTWQIERRAWKADLIARIETRLALPPAALDELLAQPDQADFRPVRATGRWLHEHEFHLAARGYRGNPGYHVVTPLLLDGGETAVLVDRGWVPLERRVPQSRAAGQATGGVVVEGIARQPTKPGAFTPDNRPDQNQWYWIDLAAMRAGAGAARLAPLLIEAGPAVNPGGLPIGGQTRVTLSNNHLQYALTWYALAVALAVIYLITARRAARAATAG